MIVVMALLASAAHLGTKHVLAIHARRMNTAALDRAQKVALARNDRNRGAELAMAQMQYQAIVDEVQDVFAATEERDVQR